jgi:PTS system beta-glucosides-specific IIC component
MSGEAAPISEVDDPTFRGDIVGKGIAIRPAFGRVVSPVNGVVYSMFRTGHAVVLASDDGVEVLIHVGVGTSRLKGKYFKARVRDGDKVKKGDLLIEFDIASVATEGFELITPVVVTNHRDFSEMTATVGKFVSEGEELIVVRK